MLSRDTKEVVVIKNINSNIVEEAILILKREPGGKEGSNSRKKQVPPKGDCEDFILQEARDIINNYIKQHKIEQKVRKGAKLKVKILRRELSLNTVINVVLMASIALLIFLITKLV